MYQSGPHRPAGGGGGGVALTAGDVPAQLPARLDLFAYRIVQEALTLTNVLKHARPVPVGGFRVVAHLPIDGEPPSIRGLVV